MDMVIVSLSCRGIGGEKNYDMEMPCHVPAEVLAKHIGQTLVNYSQGSVVPAVGSRLYCRRLGRNLEPQETFADAGIWNGDYIDLK